MQTPYYKKVDFLNSLFFQQLGRIPSFLFLGLITLYQWTLSPDHGPLSLYVIGQCKFRPTCSDYTKKTISKYGVIIGFKEGFKQIKKCHL